MLKTKPKVKDSKGNLTTYAVYLDSKFHIGKKLKELPTGVTRRKEITWREYSKIIKLYWKYTFENVVEGKIAKLRHSLGTLMVVKTLCIDYNPQKFYFIRDENGKVIGSEKRNIDVNKYNGYFYFIMYTSNKYKQYRIFPSYKIRKAYMDKVDNGTEYLDITR